MKNIKKISAISVLGAAALLALTGTTFASSYPVCAKVVNETNSTLLLNVAGSTAKNKSVSVGSKQASELFMGQTSSNPEITFSSPVNFTGNIEVYPGAVQNAASGITVQSANFSSSKCNVAYTVSVYSN